MYLEREGQSKFCVQNRCAFCGKLYFCSMPTIEEEIQAEFAELSEAEYDLSTPMSYERAKAHYGIKPTNSISKVGQVNKHQYIIGDGGLSEGDKWYSVFESNKATAEDLAKWKATKALLEKRFANEREAEDYLAGKRWEGKVCCPHCHKEKPYKTNRGYKCSNRECYKKFTVKSNTFFENSNLPLRKWLGMICLVSPKTVTSVFLSEEFDVTQSTAWKAAQKLRSNIEDGLLVKIREELISVA